MGPIMGVIAVCVEAFAAFIVALTSLCNLDRESLDRWDSSRAACKYGARCGSERGRTGRGSVKIVKICVSGLFASGRPGSGAGNRYGTTLVSCFG
jgi:hypothetical protein